MMSVSHGAPVLQQRRYASLLLGARIPVVGVRPLRTGVIHGAALVAMLMMPLCSMTQAAELPRVMSTNLCADALLLGLADDSQITSLSHQVHDPRRSSLSAAASQFASNHASAEEVIMQRPDIVLASRRWQAQHQARLFERFGIQVVNVPFPRDWAQIFETLLDIGALIDRRERAEQLVNETRERLARIRPPANSTSVLYLRGNGGTAAEGTYIDALLSGIGVINQATEYGISGWGRTSLESILLDPPEAFMISQTRGDSSLGSSGVTRHPLLRQAVSTRPVLSLHDQDNGCSNWRQVATAEQLARVLEQQLPDPVDEALP